MSEPSHDDIIQDLTPYQMTLMAMVAPWRILLLFNVVAVIGLALVGAPILALCWGAGAGAADWCFQRVYGRWLRSAADADSHEGLGRLSLVVLLRTALWLGPPLFFAVVSHSQAAFAFLVMNATTAIALGVSLGWTSLRILAAMAGPAVVALGAATLVLLGIGPAAGALVGLGSLAATLSLLGVSTHQMVGAWARANRRTIEVMAEMKLALERSEAAERRLKIAIGLANLHVYEMDYERRALTSLGAEQDFFEQPLTYGSLYEDPYFAVAPDDREATVAAWVKHEAGEGPYQAEYRVKRSDGREVWGSASAELIRDEHGRPMKLVGAIQNVTERKRGEIELTAALSRAEAGSRAKSEFLAIMSHEIRTPLNGVLGMAQAMERDRLTRAQRKRVDVIRTSGQSLLVLLNSLLDLSKIEAGKLELEVGDVDISTLAQAALDIFAVDAADKDLALTLRIAPGAEGVYSGDSQRVGQVLYNLISNAVKFTQHGAVSVEIDRRDDVLQIQVADTGIGISAEQLERLFENFSQGDASVTRRFGGTGLGLAICRQLVGMMGGEISVQSEAGRGSTFTLALPLPRLRSVAPVAESTAAASEGAEAAAQLRVLFAEDNATNQLVLRTLLQQVGIEPVVAADGEQALAAWRSREWDLILMDIQMPVMDGVTATRAIRSEEAASRRRRTPIVALTANVMSDQVEGYRAAGIDDVVAKPIEVGRLIAAIEAALDEDAADADKPVPRSRKAS